MSIERRIRRGSRIPQTPIERVNLVRYFIIAERNWQHADGIYRGEFATLATLKAGGFDHPDAAGVEYKGVEMATRLGAPVLMVGVASCRIRAVRRFFPRTDPRTPDYVYVHSL
jgi:hypothetical protein